MPQIEKIIKEKLFEDYPQKYYHSLRVAGIVRKLARDEGYNQTEILEIAALLHDISPNPGNNLENARESSKLAKKLLTSLISQDKIAIIENAILATDKKELTNCSIGESILHDANILDALGVIGLLRVACNMGKENDHDSIEDLPEWFKDYSEKLQRLIISQHAKKLAKLKLLETKKLG